MKKILLTLLSVLMVIGLMSPVSAKELPSLEKAIKDVATAKENLSKVQAELNSVKKDYEEANADVQSKLEVLQKAEIKANEANEVKSEAQKAYDEILKLEEELNNKHKSIAAELETSKTSLDKSIAGRDAVRKELDLLKGSLNYAETTALPKAQDAFNKASVSYEKLAEASDAQLVVATNATNAFNEKNERFAVLEEKVKNNTASFQELQEHVQLMQLVASLQIKMDEANKNLNETLNKKYAAFEDKTTAENKLNELKTSIKDLKDSIKANEDEDVKLTADIKKYSNLITDLEKQKIEVESKLEVLPETKDELYVSLQNATLAADKANAEKEAANKAYESALEVQKIILAKVTELEKAVNDAKTKLANAQKVLAEVEGKAYVVINYTHDGKVIGTQTITQDQFANYDKESGAGNFNASVLDLPEGYESSLSGDIAFTVKNIDGEALVFEVTKTPEPEQPEQPEQPSKPTINCAGSKDKNCDGVVTCDEEMGQGWEWNQGKKACVFTGKGATYIVNTSTK